MLCIEAIKQVVTLFKEIIIHFSAWHVYAAFIEL